MSEPVDVGKIVEQAVEDYMGKVAHADVIEALRESVKLQSHYAGLLNCYDGRTRMQFASAEEWIDRLALLKSEKNSKAEEDENAGRK